MKYAVTAVLVVLFIIALMYLIAYIFPKDSFVAEFAQGMCNKCNKCMKNCMGCFEGAKVLPESSSTGMTTNSIAGRPSEWVTDSVLTLHDKATTKNTNRWEGAQSAAKLWEGASSGKLDEIDDARVLGKDGECCHNKARYYYLHKEFLPGTGQNERLYKY